MTTPRICVVGAGAIGGLLAVKLAEAGNEVSVVIRGAHLQAVRQDGMQLIDRTGSARSVALRASDRGADLGPQDIVILAMKAHQLAGALGELPALMHADTVVITAQNGLPFWYFLRHGGPYDGRALESVDPGGVIASAFDVQRVLGCIVYPAADLVGPGVIRHLDGERLPVGELDGSDTPRVRRVAQLLRDAGFKAPVLGSIRTEIWVKLWGNCTFNPVSALTHATLADLCGHAPARHLATQMMGEAQAVANQLGVRLPVSLEQRIAGAQSVGAHKTSMLQDVEAGRPIELDALLGSVIELGQITGVPTPTLAAVYACCSLLARTLAAAGGRLRIERVDPR